MNKKKSQVIHQNNTLLNLITPQGLKFGINDIEVSDVKAKNYGIIKYPANLPYGWLSKITNTESALVCINVNPIDSGDIIDAIDNNVKVKQNEVATVNSAVQRQRAEKAVEDGLKLMKQIDQDGNAVCQMSVTYTAMADKDSVLEGIVRKAQNTISSLGAKPRLLSRRQDLGFKHGLPTFTQVNDIKDMCGRIVPLSTMVAGFPYSTSGYTDSTGDFFGQSFDGSLIMIDFWKRGGDRTNSNLVIMGNPGTGKSTVIKSIAEIEYKNGTKIIFIDPESEYRDLCRNLNGDIIYTGGGKGKINPLQIRPVPRDDDESEENETLYTDDGHGLGDMALHIKNLEIFFSLYLPELTSIQKAILKQSIIELYNKFNIFWETDISKFENTDFPIFTDLFELIQAKAKQNKDNEPYKVLELLLSDIAKGADSFLWNGHTTLNPKSKCICLDTNTLQNVSDAVKRTQYFNLLSWCWQQMSANREERVMLFADEAYLMIDPNVPQSLIFIRNVEKRARKYESAIALISHSVVDFLDPSIKQYGQAVLDVPCFKILFGTDGKNLLETKELYNLTDAEEDLLLRKQRGIGLCLIGAKRLAVDFNKMPQHRLDLMGKGGGR